METKELTVARSLPLAFQHVVAMVVGVLTVPTILGGAAGLEANELVILMQASLLTAGIAIILESTKRFGSGLPVIIGSGFAFIPTLTSIASSDGMSYVLGAQLIGAIVGILVGLSFKKVRFLFPPAVTSAVVLTVGISLYKTAVGYMAGGVGSDIYATPKAWLVALITLASAIIFSKFGKGMIRISSMLLALVVGYIVALPLGLVDFSVLNYTAFSIPKPMHFGLNFSLSGVMAMSVVFIINAIQDIGNFEATTLGAFNRNATDKELTGGVVASNMGSLLGAIFGGVPNACCGQNVGIVVTTGVTSKKVFRLAGLIIILISFFPVIASLFLTIPLPVLGGATIMVFGSIAMTGVKMLVSAGLTDRNLTIVGLSVALAIGLSFLDNAFSKCSSFTQMLFGGSEIVVVALAAIILNLILPKK